MELNGQNGTANLADTDVSLEPEHMCGELLKKDSIHRAKLQKIITKGLQEARIKINQFRVEDEKFPDLYDQLVNQSESQNYYFEPYATQWWTQVAKKGSLIPFPSIVASSLDETNVLTLSGLLEPIDHAWTSVDNRLFLWSYKNKNQFAALEFDQAIVAVGLCEKPISGIFTDKVRHLLVVATSIDVSLIAVLFDQLTTPGVTLGNTTAILKLQKTKLAVSTDNCIVRSIACTSEGRVFYGGSDETVYELTYSLNGEGAASRVTTFLPSFFFSNNSLPLCSKVARSTSYASYLPSFLAGFSGSLGSVRQLTVDNDRNILYALHESAHIQVFDLGNNAKDFKAVVSLNLLSAGIKYSREYRRTRVSCPDERHFQGSCAKSEAIKFVNICPISKSESSYITLLALTSNGIRFYLSVFSKSSYASIRDTNSASNGVKAFSTADRHKRPTRLELVYIRMPPPAVDIKDSPPYHSKEGMQPGYVSGKSPSHVHAAYYRRGVLLVANGGKDEQDQLIGIAYDAIAGSLPSIHKPALRESISLDKTLGKISDFDEYHPCKTNATAAVIDATKATAGISGSKRSFDAMTSAARAASDNTAIISEMTAQYAEHSRLFLALGNNGIQVYQKIRPLDQLNRALLLSRGSDLKRTLAPFVRCFGEVEVCAMLLALACGRQGDATGVLSSQDISIISSRNIVKTDDYLYSAAVQGIFDCGVGAKSALVSQQSLTGETQDVDAGSSRVVMKSQVEMSYYHDAIVLFVSRIIRPLWHRKVFECKSVAAAAKSSSPTMSIQKDELSQTREILFQLRQLMESTGPFAVAVDAGAMLARQKAEECDEQNQDMERTRADGQSSRVSEITARYHKSRSEDQQRQEKQFKAEQQSLFFQYKAVCRSIEAISLLLIFGMHDVVLDESFEQLSFSELATTTEGIEIAKSAIRTLMKSGRNDQNAQLIQQLREQCPSYFSVSDLRQYQGYKSLSSAKLSTAPSAQRNYLRESLNQFLSSCHMWRNEEGIEVLHTICEDYLTLQFCEGIVKLSLACARNFTDGGVYDGGFLSQDSGVSLSRRDTISYLKQCCFSTILMVLRKLLPANTSMTDQNLSSSYTSLGKRQKNQTSIDGLHSMQDDTREELIKEILQHALASEDEDFHVLLYSWLREHGHTQMLLTIRTPFLEPFLQSQDEDLLVQLYMEQQKYLLAAKVWWNRSHEDFTDDTCDVEPSVSSVDSSFQFGSTRPNRQMADIASLEKNPNITKRQHYVSKTLACLKALETVDPDQYANTLDAVQEVQDMLDVLDLQARVLRALEQSTIALEADVATSPHPDPNVDDEIRTRRDDIILLEYKMFDASTLYNQFASKYDMWAECLHIIRVCRTDEADIIAALWRKIIFGVIPNSSSSSEFNDWLDRMRAEAQLENDSVDTSANMSFESGMWIGQIQCTIHRLGKILLAKDWRNADVNQTMVTDSSVCDTPVFPIGFLSHELERLSLWYIRLTRELTSFDARGTPFNWVVKLFIDLDIPYRVILSYYEELYREESGHLWMLHILHSIYMIMNLWRKHSLLLHVQQEDLSEFAGSVPHLVELCDDFIMDMQSIPTDSDNDDANNLSEGFRNLKRDLINFRTFP